MPKFFGRGLLAAAGAVSGFGQGLEKAAAEGQKYLGFEALLERRSEFDMQKIAMEDELAGKRQATTMGHERALQREKIASDQAIANQRSLTEIKRTGMQEEGATGRTQLTTGAQKDIATLESGTRKEIAGMQILSAEKIATLQAENRKDVVNIQESGLNARLAEQIRSSRDELLLKLRSTREEASRERLMHRQMQTERERGLDLRLIREHAHRLKEAGLLSDAAMARLDKEIVYKAEEGVKQRAHEKEQLAAEMGGRKEIAQITAQAQAALKQIYDLPAEKKVQAEAIISRMKANEKQLDQLGILEEDRVRIGQESQRLYNDLLVVLGKRAPKGDYKFPDFGPREHTTPSAAPPATQAPPKPAPGVLSGRQRYQQSLAPLPGTTGILGRQQVP